MLQRGDFVPHFEVKTIGGDLFSYSTIWQRRNVVLLLLPAGDSESTGRYVSRLLARTSEFTANDTECVVTREPAPGIHGPSVTVADRWGEMVHVSSTSEVEDLPSPEDLLHWVDYLERRCSECEGEAK